MEAWASPLLGLSNLPTNQVSRPRRIRAIQAQGLGRPALRTPWEASGACHAAPRCIGARHRTLAAASEERARWGEVDLVFYLTRAAWPYLKDSRGVVVNMASLNASLSFKILPSLAHSTNKAGIIAMTRQLAVEGREHGIRANSISPGLIESNATRDQLKDPEWASYMLGKTLLGRLGRPEEVANVALFLASERVPTSPASTSSSTAA